MRFILGLTLFFCVQAKAEVSLQEFQTLRDIFFKEYAPELSAQNSELFINEPPPQSPEDFWWNLPTIRAAYATYLEGGVQRRHYLTLMGGYGKLPWMTLDNVAATLCHELGHGLGGEPVKDSDEVAKSSTEGQADDFAYRNCLPRIFIHFPPKEKLQPVSAFTDQLCREAYAGNKTQYDYCTRAFHSLEVERKYFEMDLNVKTSYESPDLTVAEKIDLHPDFYPGAQCRLDTMMAGILGHARPGCWYRP